MNANLAAILYLISGVLFILALSLDVKSGEFALAREDEIVQATLVCENGQPVAAK